METDKMNEISNKPESDSIECWQNKLAVTSALEKRADALALVSSPTRLRIFYLLSRMGEVGVCDLAAILNVTQSAVSQHLAKFRAMGLVDTRRKSQNMFYRLNDNPTNSILKDSVLKGIDPLVHSGQGVGQTYRIYSYFC
jgi:ArsR family transcriptional regulator, virulence genes transcriptional regulator